MGRSVWGWAKLQSWIGELATLCLDRWKELDDHQVDGFTNMVQACGDDPTFLLEYHRRLRMHNTEAQPGPVWLPARYTFQSESAVQVLFGALRLLGAPEETKPADSWQTGGGEAEPRNTKARAALVWVGDHILGTVIGSLILAALLTWMRLG
jgi:hypothetical protein